MATEVISKEDIERMQTRLNFNCDECASYWRSMFQMWKGLGEGDLCLITLHCPVCNRPELRR